jgi:pimeloyl-ACP methyl ester carboxylesterase
LFGLVWTKVLPPHSLNVGYQSRLKKPIIILRIGYYKLNFQDFMKNKNISAQIIQLKDGRSLAFKEYGIPDGKPLFYLHGFPGSRLEAALLARTALNLDVRIISPDRPGMGFSSFKKNREVLDIADDVLELADYLGIRRFAITGLSGGGPYVSACAYKIPRRLTGASIISGLGPAKLMKGRQNMLLSSRLALWLGCNASLFSGMSFNLMAKYLGLTRDLSIFKNLPEPDQLALKSPEVKEIIRNSMLEAFRDGARGAVWDARLLARPWKFNLSEIDFPIQIWHGEQDRNAPVLMGIQVANSIPGSKAKFFKDEGHFSLVVNHTDEIIASLVS